MNALLVAEQLGNIGTTLADVQIISLLVGTVLSILVGTVTKVTTHPGVKAVLLAVLSAISGFATEYFAGGSDFNLTTALLTWLITLMIAIASHFGVWKPTGIAASAQAIGSGR